MEAGFRQLEGHASARLSPLAVATRVRFQAWRGLEFNLLRQG